MLNKFPFIKLAYRTHIFMAAALFILVCSACSATKNIPQDKYLLENTKLTIVSDSKKPEIQAPEIDKYIRQKPNKKVLGFKLHLGLYNLAKPNKEKGLSKVLRNIGEEPVLLDTFQTKQSTSNLLRYITSKGYYSATVKDTTILQHKKANVRYQVSLGKPHRIRKITYSVEDTTIRRIVLSDTSKMTIRKGNRFDIDRLREERIRIEKRLKEEGYFFFSRDFVTFDADTSIGNKQVDLELIIRNRFTRNDFGEKLPQKYRKYEISNVYIYTKYDPVEFFYLQKENFLDTIVYDNQHFIYDISPGIRLKALTSANLIRPGQVYSESVVEKTRNNLNSLKLYRAVNIFFLAEEQEQAPEENNFIFFGNKEEGNPPSMGKLTCHIQLTPHTLQSYQVDLVGTNTTSNIGAEANLNYQHKNIFRGAEIFETKLRGMVQFITGENFGASSIEYGGSVGINFPRFLSPFSGKEYETRYSPRTIVTASYNYQNRPEFTRTIGGLNLSYNWKSESRYTHTFSPIEVNLINLFSISNDFLRIIESSYQINSFKNEFVTLTKYGFIYTNQAGDKKDFSVVRYNVEVSGNILNGSFNILKKHKVDGAYQIFNTNFSQFIRTDVNYVFNQVVDANNTFVYRIFAGAGLPYGNSAALPFEKKYFSGGSTGIRAWHARGLGPGSFIETRKKILYETADIKLEANLEYRFKLVWLLEGALFFDAGNIWAISTADDRPGALFKLDSFYKQIALGTGAGIRMNLGFFTLRFDLGVKVYDPSKWTLSKDNKIVLHNNQHWIPLDRKYSWSNDFVIHFGIGYPF